MGINIIWLTIVKGRFQPFPAQYVDLSVMPQNIQNIHFTVAYILSSSTAFMQSSPVATQNTSLVLPPSPNLATPRQICRPIYWDFNLTEMFPNSKVSSHYRNAHKYHKESNQVEKPSIYNPILLYLCTDAGTTYFLAMLVRQLNWQMSRLFVSLSPQRENGMAIHWALSRLLPMAAGETTRPCMARSS